MTALEIKAMWIYAIVSLVILIMTMRSSIRKGLSPWDDLFLALPMTITGIALAYFYMCT